MPDRVALVLSARATPQAVNWHGRHFRVTDTPTRLDIDPVVMTHPLPTLVAWRFQGTSDDGQAYVFDIRLGSDGETWWLLHAYQ